MKINVSDILKNHGDSLKIELNEVMPELDSVQEGYIFSYPVSFQGQLVNFSGILKLKGDLKTHFTAKCFRCLKDIDVDMNIEIKEDFADAEKKSEDEAYTYQGNFVELDKVFKDNIILNLPMRQLCTDDCKGFCSKCGCNLNEVSCECKEDTINPQMEVLKNFFNN